MNLTKKNLYDLYVAQGLSSYQIAKDLNVSSRYIRMKLKEFGINRTQKQAATNRLKNLDDYSPILSHVRWQLPTKRRETYCWSRHFSRNPYIGNAIIKLCSPMNFLIKKDEDICPPLDNFLILIQDFMPQIMREYLMFGDCFLHIVRDEYDGILNFHLLQPDNVEVKTNPLNTNDKHVYLLPDSLIVEAVKNDDINVPNQMKKLILEKKPIPISSNDVKIISRNKIPYMTYGESMVAPYFQELSLIDKLLIEKGYSKEAMEEYSNVINVIDLSEREDVLKVELDTFKNIMDTLIRKMIVEEFHKTPGYLGFKQNYNL